ncbi:hypothetical protein [Paraburkholderia antibiotica]|uniref:Uncharacterized protein n=1 Tax=Paraburkholderia antibiotica TaxID=2728839 RepID=A0A7X9ZXU4_9BURK|nr:hypothetical protein [Paraburkholderia antibiotica]NML32437.1 hypothetical protein [Paraburkholderia antibiotica]
MAKRYVINAALAPLLAVVILGSITFAVGLALFDAMRADPKNRNRFI